MVRKYYTCGNEFGAYTRVSRTKIVSNWRLAVNIAL